MTSTGVAAEPRWRDGSPHLSNPSRERFWTPATWITIVRTVVSGLLAFAAAKQGDLTLLLAALGVYWVGDVADGACARHFDHETRYGAILDIVCDRFNAAMFYAGLVWLQPELTWPVALYVAEFMTIDTFNSLTFLAWPVRSPNYFHEVDNKIWLMNWSKPAKAANSAIFAILMVWTGWVWLGFLIAGAMWLVKIWTLRRLLGIGLPLPSDDVLPSPPGDTSLA